MGSTPPPRPVPDLEAGVRKVFEAEYLTLNERRQRDGYPPILGGDIFMGVRPLSRAVMASPAPRQPVPQRIISSPPDSRSWDERSLDHAVKEAQREVAAWFNGEIYVWKPFV